jgi:hypothetical protein
MAGVSLYRHGGVVIMTDIMKITIEDSGAPEGFDLRHERMGGRNSFSSLRGTAFQARRFVITPKASPSKLDHD